MFSKKSLVTKIDLNFHLISIICLNEDCFGPIFLEAFSLTQMNFYFIKSEEDPLNSLKMKATNLCCGVAKRNITKR